MDPTPDPRAGIENRLPAWDPPAQQRAMYCDLRPLAESGRWQVFGRSEDRCNPLEPISTVDSEYGEAVVVPDPGPNAVTVLRLHGTEIRGRELLRALVLRPRARYLVVNGQASYRLATETAADGLMVRGGIPDASGKISPDIPQADTLVLTGSEGDLRNEFLRMPVDRKSVARRTDLSRTAAGGSP